MAINETPTENSTPSGWYRPIFFARRPYRKRTALGSFYTWSLQAQPLSRRGAILFPTEMPLKSQGVSAWTCERESADEQRSDVLHDPQSIWTAIIGRVQADSIAVPPKSIKSPDQVGAAWRTR